MAGQSAWGRRYSRKKGPLAPRVARALVRLSRERWILPTQVRRIAIDLAACKSAHPQWTAQRAFPIECEVVGMLRGEPPVPLGHPNYRCLVQAIKDTDFERLKVPPELWLLQFFTHPRKRGLAPWKPINS